jgi:hypothetical protein
MASNGDYSRKELWRKAKTRAMVLHDAEIQAIGLPSVAAEATPPSIWSPRSGFADSKRPVNITDQIESPRQRYFPGFPLDFGTHAGGNGGAMAVLSVAKRGNGTWSRLRIQRRSVARR